MRHNALMIDHAWTPSNLKQEEENCVKKFVMNTGKYDTEIQIFEGY